MPMLFSLIVERFKLCLTGAVALCQKLTCCFNSGGWWYSRREMTIQELKDMKARELNNGRLASAFQTADTAGKMNSFSFCQHFACAWSWHGVRSSWHGRIIHLWQDG
jgi:hypothetical protein